MTEYTSPADLALGRSLIRRRILGLLIADPSARLHLREIQRRARTSPGTASRELGRLLAAGLVERQAEGAQVYFRLASSPAALAFRAFLAAQPVVQPVPEAAIEPEPRVPESSSAAPNHTRQPRTIRPSGTASRGHRPDPVGLEVAARLAQVLRPLYAGRLVGIFLYGARARGESLPDADVEIAVVLEEIHSYGEELERSSPTCASLSLEFGAIVSRVFVSEDTWKTRADGQMAAVRAEAVAV